MLHPVRHTPIDPVDADLGCHLDATDAEEARQAAIDALVKSDYIDTDLLAEGGFVAEFFEELMPDLPTALVKKLEEASQGYKCQHHGGPHTSTAMACSRVGRVLLDWMFDRAHEIAEERLKKECCHA